MALDMFLKFGDGSKIKGESKVEGHTDEIELLAWSWGVSQSGTMHYGEGGGAGKANVQDMSVSKWVDGGSAGILKCCIAGEHIDKAVLLMRKAGGIANKQVDFLRITMEDCLITSYNTGGSGGEDRLTENVSINFGKVKFETLKQGKDGTIKPAAEASYSIAEQKVS